MNKSRLFSPIQVGSLEIPNRIVFPPMDTRFSEPGGFVGRTLIDYYARRAEGGAGLVIVEYAAVDGRHFPVRDQLRIYDDRFVPGLRDLAQAIKALGARAAIQLHHPGRQTHSTITGRQPIAPSAVPCPVFGEVPHEMTVDEIGDLVEMFARAAMRAREAGFDAVQLHGGHGYLISQFFSQLSNKRTDQYGGDVAGRGRFATAVIQRCKALAGEDFPVILRISGDEYLPGGVTIVDSKEFARMAVGAGADAIDVSAGHLVTVDWTIMPHFRPRGSIIPLAATIKQVVSVPVVAVGRINDAHLAERVLADNQADMVAMGRALIADPDLPRKALAGDGRLHRCIACNSCIAGDNRVGLHCVVNPNVGLEGTVEPAAAQHRKVIVVGAGPAGMAAARIARLRGHDTALWDQRVKPGGPWAYLVDGFIKERLQDLREVGVRLSLGKEASIEALVAEHPDVVLVTPALIPRNGPLLTNTSDSPLTVLTADELLDGAKVTGRRVVVLGSGSTACEASQALLRQGLTVTMVDFTGRVGEGIGKIHRKMLLEKMRADGLLTIRRATELKQVAVGLAVGVQDGEDIPLAVDTVIFGLGYDRDESLVAKLREAGVDARPLPACEVPQTVIAAMVEGAAVARAI